MKKLQKFSVWMNLSYILFTRRTAEKAAKRGANAPACLISSIYIKNPLLQVTQKRIG